MPGSAPRYSSSLRQQRSQRKLKPEADRNPRDLRRTALELLGRREHSRRELEQKLLDRHHPAADVTGLLDELEVTGLLSDARYAEAYTHSRFQRGYGPLRIVADLRQRGLDPGLITACVERYSKDWQTAVAAARSKRFGDGNPGSYKEKVRQARFLQQRGFTVDQINALFKDDLAHVE